MANAGGGTIKPGSPPQVWSLDPSKVEAMAKMKGVV
jgi:hypothetical protein